MAKTKYRPERIELKVPNKSKVFTDKINDMLCEHLHQRAKLERTEDKDMVTFAFYPTKSECFIIFVELRCLEYKRKKQRKPI